MKQYSAATIALAKEMARVMIKQAIKHKGAKISCVSAKDLDRHSIHLLLITPSILKKAERETNRSIKRRSK